MAKAKVKRKSAAAPATANTAPMVGTMIGANLGGQNPGLASASQVPNPQMTAMSPSDAIDAAEMMAETNNPARAAVIEQQVKPAARTAKRVAKVKRKFDDSKYRKMYYEQGKDFNQIADQMDRDQK